MDLYIPAEALETHALPKPSLHTEKVRAHIREVLAEQGYPEEKISEAAARIAEDCQLACLS